ncbi:MAG: hypothetical protein JEZ07_19590 [Phycisphaerae bacterium]|nr:hypothetical protein [Phycisphaerae bacterium]
MSISKKKCSILLLVIILFAAMTGTVQADQKNVTASEIDRAIGNLENFARLDESKLDYLEVIIAANEVLYGHDPNDAMTKQIELMAAEAKKIANNSKDYKIQGQALNTVIFKKYGFKKPNTRAPIISGKNVIKQYMLKDVLEHKQAHCEGMSMIYFLVGQKAGFPVEIVNIPIHTYCRVGAGSEKICVELTRNGAFSSESRYLRMNGAKPAAQKSGTYFSGLSKKQFLNLQINSLAYGLITQPQGIKPLNMKQMVRLARLIEKLDPNRPESLDTAALIYYKAGEPAKALKTINHAMVKAKELGNAQFVFAEFAKRQKEFSQGIKK